MSNEQEHQETKENIDSDGFIKPVEPKKSITDIEKEQEAQLRSKYPALGGRGGGNSAFLQKRLSKGQQKYFDSGDYNMAKAKGAPGAKGPGLLAGKVPGVVGGPAAETPNTVTGDTIPTPESVPLRKSSIAHMNPGLKHLGGL